MIEVDLVYNGIPEDRELERAARLGALTALKAENAEGDICIELTNDPIIHLMNREMRGVDRPTDVLSFPANEGEELISIPDGHLGDIMISLDTAKRQAEEFGHSAAREVAFLAIHGALHVLGYDHILPEDEEIMTAKQRELIAIIEGALSAPLEEI